MGHENNYLMTTVKPYQEPGNMIKFFHNTTVLLLILFISTLLAACGASSGTDGDTPTTTSSVVTVQGSGEPVNVTVDSVPTSLQVTGTSGTDISTITVTVVDEKGTAYKDSANNIKFEIINGPGGGELLDSGDGTPATSKTLTTSGGTASLLLRSGSISGTVTTQIAILNDAAGNPLGSQIISRSTDISIEAGTPADILIYRDNTMVDNKDGSISQAFSALVKDQYGNPVKDNTAVYFGIIDNQPNGYLVNGTDGTTTSSSATFTSATSDFSTLKHFDTLIITSGNDQGGHIVLDAAPSGTSITLSNTMNSTASSLSFVAGNAELGTVCGTVPTGTIGYDTTCSPTDTGIPAIKGIAHTLVTWPSQATWQPFTLYAETEGRTLGAYFSGTYSAVAPVTIDVTLPYSTVTGGTPVNIYAHIYDGANNDLGGLTLTFTTDNSTDTGFGAIGTASTTSVADANGYTSAVTLNTQAVTADTSVTITVSMAQYSGTAALTLKP